MRPFLNREKKNIGIYRSSELIADRTGKMAIPYICSSLCVSVITAVDALIAGAFIGYDALAAVAAAAPLLAIEPILHCLFGFGIDKLMIRAIGCGNRREANRIFGTVLITVLVSYIIVIAPMLIWCRQLISVNLKDKAMVELIYQYCIPRLVMMPLLEICLCCERAFRIDGRAVLFSVRTIVCSVLNIILDIIMVSVLGLGVRGLSWATVISSLLGFTVSLSHFFSKKRTVTPDLSVIRSFPEMWGFIKEDVRIGSSATLDELLETALINAQTGAVSYIGGTAALAVWSVYKSLRSVVFSLGNGISASVTVHAGLLYGEKDYDGVRYSLKSGAKQAQWTCLVLIAIVHLLAEPISDLYGIEPALRDLCASCLRIGSLAFPVIALTTVFISYLPCVDRTGTASAYIVILKCFPLLTAVIARSFGLHTYYLLYLIAMFVCLMILEILIRCDGSWFVPKKSHIMISSYSVKLDPFYISAVSSGISCDLKLAELSGKCIPSSSLVVEESLNYILKQNPNDEIRADIMLDRHETGIQITIIDDGPAYNPIPNISLSEPASGVDLEETILSGLTIDTKYDRVIDLNHLTMFVAAEFSDTVRESDHEF